MEALAKPILLGLGAAIGSGHQYIPWIHIEDMCHLYLEAVKNDDFKGAYNAVASESVTNYSFTKQVAKTLNKPFWLPNIPKFIISLLLGEMSTVILNGSRVSSKKIISTGFTFKYNSKKL